MSQNVFIRAIVPAELQQAFLQHIRDFDTAHAACHFEIMVDAPDDLPMAEIVKRLVIEPELKFKDFFKRGRQ